MPYPVLDQPEVVRALFHPRPESAWVIEDARSRTVSFALPEGVTVGGRLHAAGTTAPVVVLFHGNGEIASDYDDLATAYGDLGLTLLVVDYRGYGISTGVPSARALVEDAVAVFERAPALVEQYGLTPSAWLVMGRSLGSAAALAVAADAPARGVGPRLAGLIIESGFCDTLPLVERLGARMPADANEARDGFGNRARIAAVTVPTRIIHGRDDVIIPFTDAECLLAASGATDKALVVIRGAGHNDLIAVNPKAYFTAIAGVWQGQALLPP